MRKGIATKNVIGGNCCPECGKPIYKDEVDDFYDKKTYIKVSNRKVRKEGKKICRDYIID